MCSAAHAKQLAAMLHAIVKTEWEAGADGMFDENDMIDCTIICYWSNNDSSKPSGRTKNFPDGCIKHISDAQL